jgi:hypothetical protein
LHRDVDSGAGLATGEALMSEIKDIIPLLPEQWATALAAASGLLLLVPKTFDALRSARGYSYEREKRQLQLLKLRYEIEALRKEKGLEDLSSQVLGEGSAPGLNSRPAAAAPTSGLQRFLLGSLGGALLPLVKVILSGSLGPSRPWATYVGMGAAITLIASLGGLVALLIGNRATPRWACSLLGLSGSLVLMSLFAAAVSSAEQS